jgi:hypothetical protein
MVEKRHEFGEMTTSADVLSRVIYNCRTKRSPNVLFEPGIGSGLLRVQRLPQPAPRSLAVGAGCFSHGMVRKAAQADGAVVVSL